MRRGRIILLFLSCLWCLSLPFIACATENIFGFQDDNPRNIRYFPQMAEIGVKWVRTYIYWSDIEPVRKDPPQYHWEKYDELFKRLMEMGLTPIVIIAGNPSWISTYPGGPFDKGDVKDYLRFVETLVERYDGDRKNDASGSPKILYWEIYNEPDLTSARLAQYPVWGFWGKEPVKYARLLKAVYPVIKRACPEAQLVFGGIALDEWSTFNSKFLEEVLKAGAGPYFDIMNFHFYLPFHVVWDRYGPDLIGKVNYIKNVLDSYGLRKEIFCTEAGHWSEQNSSPEFQASYLVKVFVRGMAADLKSIIWFTLTDSNTKGTDPTRGLFDIRLNKKPAYDALKHLISYLKGAIYRQPLLFTGEVHVHLDWAERVKDKLSPHSMMEGYTFYKVDQRKNAHILWSNSNEFKVDLIGKSFRVYDRYGKMTKLRASYSDSLSFPVGSDPVFLERDD